MFASRKTRMYQLSSTVVYVINSFVPNTNRFVRLISVCRLILQI